MVDSILDSLIESGGVTEVQILAALHSTGQVDVVKLITEVIDNTKREISNGDAGKLFKLGKVDEIIRHWEVVREIIDMEPDEDIDDCDIDGLTDIPQTLTVMV